MPVSFAPARTIAASPVARALARQARKIPANDDADVDHDQLLGAALRHFARHGLGAARAAQLEAEAALDRGDVHDAEGWLAIGRQFDRRLAPGLAQRIAGRQSADCSNLSG